MPTILWAAQVLPLVFLVEQFCGEISAVFVTWFSGPSRTSLSCLFMNSFSVQTSQNKSVLPLETSADSNGQSSSRPK